MYILYLVSSLPCEPTAIKVKGGYDSSRAGGGGGVKRGHCTPPPSHDPGQKVALLKLRDASKYGVFICCCCL